MTDATRDFMGTVFKLEEAQSPERAAEPLLWLATLPPDSQGPHGELSAAGLFPSLMLAMLVMLVVRDGSQQEQSLETGLSQNNFALHKGN